jgi:hypothetical protein
MASTRGGAVTISERRWRSCSAPFSQDSPQRRDSSDGFIYTASARIAERMGVAAQVSEEPARLPYFEALQLLKDAHFLFVLGSDDPAYTASKIYPYILAKKPLFAIVHEHSTLVDVIRDTHAGTVATFGSTSSAPERARIAEQLATAWTDILEDPERSDGVDWSAFERYTAREMTRRQCELFDEVVARVQQAAA